MNWKANIQEIKKTRKKNIFIGQTRKIHEFKIKKENKSRNNKCEK